MARYLSFNIVSQQDSGVAGISPVAGAGNIWGDGTLLIQADKIISVVQATVGTVAITLDSSVGAFDTVTFTAGTTVTGTTVGNLPANTVAPGLLKQAINYAQSANPGGIKANVSLPLDQAATPVQIYWRAAVWS
jgi:hypothetical protein